MTACASYPIPSWMAGFEQLGTPQTDLARRAVRPVAAPEATAAERAGPAISWARSLGPWRTGRRRRVLGKSWLASSSRSSSRRCRGARWISSRRAGITSCISSTTSGRSASRAGPSSCLARSARLLCSGCSRRTCRFGCRRLSILASRRTGTLGRSSGLASFPESRRAKHHSRTTSARRWRDRLRARSARSAIQPCSPS
jgi:hypothetical protein